MEVYDPSTGNWSTGPALPSEVRSGMAMTVGAKIYLITAQPQAQEVYSDSNEKRS